MDCYFHCHWQNYYNPEVEIDTGNGIISSLWKKKIWHLNIRRRKNIKMTWIMLRNKEIKRAPMMETTKIRQNIKITTTKRGEPFGDQNIFFGFQETYIGWLHSNTCNHNNNDDLALCYRYKSDNHPTSCEYWVAVFVYPTLHSMGAGVDKGCHIIYIFPKETRSIYQNANIKIFIKLLVTRKEQIKIKLTFFIL